MSNDGKSPVTKRKYSRTLLAAVAQNKQWPLVSQPEFGAFDVPVTDFKDADYEHWQTLAETEEPDALWVAYLEWQGIIGFASTLKRHCLELFGA
jgi:hypothetical protein